MKYAAVFFDWGDTLSPLVSGVPILNSWAGEIIRDLYCHSYRLAIISNTHRYQDGHWIRTELAKRNLLQYFEVVIASATYAIHKPNLNIFHKALAFMQVSPRKVIMVGDSEHCDGACQYLGMDYLPVNPEENWSEKLTNSLMDERGKRERRVLSNLYEYFLDENKLRVKIRHLSEPLVVNNRFMLGLDEYRVKTMPRQLTKEQILKAKDEFIEFEVERVNGA